MSLILYRCDPVFVQYQFPSLPTKCTEGLAHASTLNFRSTDVLFLGNIEQTRFIEFLRGPPLTFELHDRDCRLVPKSSHVVFGEDSTDDIIGTHMFGVNLNNNRLGDIVAREDSSDTKKKNVDPYGIASFDLTGFLRGERKLEVTAPVLRSPRVSASEQLPSRFRPDQVQKPGDYLESGCEMSVTFELWRPLIVLSKKSSRRAAWKSKGLMRTLSKIPSNILSSCPFNRLVYIISSSQGTSLLKTILERVNGINAAALGLGYLPADVLPAALSTYKLTKLVDIVILL